MPQKIRVLIVDDSAFARKVLREVLEKDSAIEVIGFARDGLEALEKIAELDPDVVTLDLVMPDLDGIGVLESLKKTARPRVIVVSISGGATDLGLRALDLGAVDIVTKPTPLPTDRLYELSNELIFKIKSASAAKERAPSPTHIAPTAAEQLARRYGIRVIAIGTSTGGPQALTQIFKDLPANFPVPLVLALHIPSGYTEAIAARLTDLGGITVREARSGMKLRQGLALIAPGGQHLSVLAEGDELIVQVSDEPTNTLYHPSVNLLFESVARTVGRHSIGVILTGMGDDGLIGAKAIHQAGGVIIAESEESCIVYGMPRVVIESGLSDAQAPLEEIASLLAHTVGD